MNIWTEVVLPLAIFLWFFGSLLYVILEDALYLFLRKHAPKDEY